jgi:hypothetical protein
VDCRETDERAIELVVHCLRSQADCGPFASLKALKAPLINEMPHALGDGAVQASVRTSGR